MAIAKKVIDEHGSRIDVISEIGAGTELSVALPIQQEDLH